MRKKFRKAVSAILVAAIVLTMFSVNVMAVSAKDFVDFPSDWSAEAMTAAVENGLIMGRTSTEIVPYGILTRAEMAAIINRAFGANKTAPISQYEDVSVGDWFYGEMSKAVKMQTFTGVSDTQMMPDAYITRQEAFTVVARAMVISSADHSSLDKFVDKSDIADWALDSVSAMVKNGYVNGNEMNEIKPLDYITRAEFAQMMYNMFKTYFSTGGFRSGITCDGNVMINTEAVSLTNVTINGDLIIGEGANETQIMLTNVNITGRLLVRGASYVRITATNIGGGIIVNNFNNVVYFDNYRSEAAFANVVENTAAKYKEGSFSVSTNPGSSSSSSSSSAEADYTVEIYEQNTEKTGYDLVSTEKFTEIVGYEVNATIPTKEGFILNTSLSKVSGIVDADGKLVLKIYYDRITKVIKFEYSDDVVFDGDKNEGYEAAYGDDIDLPTNVRKEEGGKIYAVDYWVDALTGTVIYPNEDKKITDDMILTPQFTEGCLLTFTDGRGNTVASLAVKKDKKISESLKKMPSVYEYGYWESPYNVWDGNSYRHTIEQDFWYDKSASDAVYNLDSVVSADATLNPAWKQMAVTISDSSISKSGTASVYYNSNVRYADTVKDFIFKNKNFIENTEFIDIKNEYLNKLKANNILDDDKNILKYKSVLSYKTIFGEEFLRELMGKHVPAGADSNTFVNDIINEMSTKSQITVNADRMEVIKALRGEVAGLEYYKDIASKVPANYKQYLSETDQLAIFASAKSDSLSQLDTAINNGSGVVVCNVELAINPVSSVLIPIYDELVDKYENTAYKVWNTSENYKKLIELISPENLLNGTKTAETVLDKSGYSLKTMDEYYEILKEASVLLDKANEDFVNAIDNNVITKAQYEAFANILPNHIISYMDLINTMGTRFFGSSFGEITADKINTRFEYLTNLYEMHNFTTDQVFSRRTSESSSVYTIVFGALEFKFVRSTEKF